MAAAAAVKIGTLAATKQSWRGAVRKHRDLIVLIYERFPHADDDRLFREYVQRLLAPFKLSNFDEVEDLEAALRYSFDGGMSALRKGLRNARDKAEDAQRRAQRAVAKAEEAEAYAEAVTQRADRVQEAKQMIKREILLNMVESTTGKRLRHLTGDECGKLGGWYKQLAKAHGKTIGEYFSAEDVQRLYEKHGPQ
jgi:hypothetical protein